MTNTYSAGQFPPGRLQAILTSPGPIFIVVADHSFKHNLSVAQRLAHVLHVHHRLDCDVVDERTAIERTTRGTWTAGNIVFVGPPKSNFATNVLAKNRTPVSLADGMIRVGGQAFSKREQGVFSIPAAISHCLKNFRGQPSFSRIHILPAWLLSHSYYLLYITVNRHLSEQSACSRFAQVFPVQTGL